MKSIHMNTKLNIDVGKDKERLEKSAKKANTTATSLARLFIIRGLEDLESGKLVYEPPKVTKTENDD